MDLPAKIRSLPASAGVYLYKNAEGEIIMSDKKDDSAPSQAGRREALRRLGRFAAVTPPAVALVLAAKTKPANAVIISLQDDVHP